MLISESDAPGKEQSLYMAALKTLDANNTDEGIKQLELAVNAVPKFADGWNILGALYERQMMFMEARDALQHAFGSQSQAGLALLEDRADFQQAVLIRFW